MNISLTTSRTKGFKKWSDANRPSNDDDIPGGATPTAVTAGDADTMRTAPFRADVMRNLW